MSYFEYALCSLIHKKNAFFNINFLNSILSKSIELYVSNVNTTKKQWFIMYISLLQNFVNNKFYIISQNM